MSVIGYVNQYESMGNLDGPGTRFVVFLQGCPLKCKYCHNPETIKVSDESIYEKTSDEVVNEIFKLQSYYRNGGVTISGGEPLLQMDFIIDIAKKIKKLNLHLAIDTSGYLFNKNNDKFMDKFNELIKYVDLFLVDIKHIDDEKCRFLTSQGNKNSLELLRYLNEKNIAVWIRYVLIPGLSDDKNDLIKTGEFINTLNNIENVEILPYHDMAKAKWKEQGMEYEIADIRSANKEDVQKAYKIMFNL